MFFKYQILTNCEKGERIFIINRYELFNRRGFEIVALIKTEP